jgi:hypothetical protein
MHHAHLFICFHTVWNVDGRGNIVAGLNKTYNHKTFFIQKKKEKNSKQNTSVLMGRVRII